MFTFQAPPYFFISDLDVSNAHISHFTPLYCSNQFSNRYHSPSQPLHYQNKLLVEVGDLVLHLVEEQGRVVRVEIAQVWGTLYYEDQSPIGVLLVPPNQIILDDYEIFTRINQSGDEKQYYQNANTLNQKQIYQNIQLISRKNPIGQIWQPESKSTQDHVKLDHLLPYPRQINNQFLHAATVHYAKLKYPASLFAVAFWFREQGRIAQAIHGFQKAAELQFPFAWLELGFEYLENGALGDHPDKSVSCFRQAAYFSVPLANYHLALAYINGAGIEQNDRLALSHLQKAKDGQIWAAYLALALYYRDGSFNHFRAPSNRDRLQHHQSIDYSLAAKYFFHAANQDWSGAPIAAYYLAECYRKGAGVQMDESYATELYQKAVECGNLQFEEIQSAAYYIGDVERLTQIAENYPFAAYLVGKMYWFGKFAPLNIQIAKRYLKIAAQSGHHCAEDASQLLQSVHA